MTTHHRQPYPQHDPYGRAYAPPPAKKTRRWPWILGIVAAFVFGNMTGNAASTTTPTSAASAPSLRPAAPANDDTSSAETAEAAEAPPSGPEAGTIPQGEWLVGDEVAPGRYRSAGAVEGIVELCSAATHDADGGVLEWKTGNVGEQVLINVTEGATTVSNSGCEPFTKVS